MFVSKAAHFDEQQHVEHFGLPLPVLLSQHQHIQHVGPHPLTHVGQARLQLRHGVHAALTVLDHLREQQGERTQTHFSLGSTQGTLQDGGFPSSEPRVHFLYLGERHTGLKLWNKRWRQRSFLQRKLYVVFWSNYSLNCF